MLDRDISQGQGVFEVRGDYSIKFPMGKEEREIISGDYAVYFYNQILNAETPSECSFFRIVFDGLRFEEQQSLIRIHEWCMGEKANHYIGYGNAALDLYERMGVDVGNYIEIIKRLEDKKYGHCNECGYLFDEEFKKENRIGFITKNPGRIFKPFNISSSYCDDCLEEVRDKNKRLKIAERLSHDFRIFTTLL